jgi:type I restriction enzyme, S subunit
MAGKWIDHAPLASLCLLLNRGIAPAYSETGGVVVLNQRCVRDGRVEWSAAKFTDPTRKSIPSDKMLQRFDILVNSTGVGTLGRVAQLTSLDIQATADSHITIVRPQTDRVNPHYLGLVLRDRQADIEALAQGSTGQTELSRSSLGALEISIPPIHLQAAIANLLGSLDDKIELNRRMAATLEEMARALFKSWFVDFDPVHAKAEGRTRNQPAIAALFPSRFSDDGLPEGWALGSVADILEINPSTPLRVGTHAPYVDMAALPSAGPSISCFITRDASSGSRFRRDDTLVARITPCLENGKTALVDFLPEGQVGWGSTEFIVLRPRITMSYAWPYLLARYEPFRAHLIGAMTGSSGRQRVPPSAVAAWEMALPPSEVLSAFAAIIDPMFTRITAAAQESVTLRHLRDTLLPKLISGELRIKDAKNAVEAA